METLREKAFHKYHCTIFQWIHEMSNNCTDVCNASPFFGEFCLLFVYGNRFGRDYRRYRFAVTRRCAAYFYQYFSRVFPCARGGIPSPSGKKFDFALSSFGVVFAFVYLYVLGPGENLSDSGV